MRKAAWFSADLLRLAIRCEIVDTHSVDMTEVPLPHLPPSYLRLVVNNGGGHET